MYRNTLNNVDISNNLMDKSHLIYFVYKVLTSGLSLNKQAILLKAKCLQIYTHIHTQFHMQKYLSVFITLSLIGVS